MLIELPIPHPYQDRILNEAGRFNVLQCGRRFGKTMLGTMLAACPAIQGHPVGWFAPTYKLLAEPWADLQDILRPIVVRASVQEHRLELTTGGSIDLWTLDGPNPNSGRGRKYARVVVDEYSFVPSLETAWNQAIRPTLTDLKGDAWFLGTPHGRGYSHTLYLKGQQQQPGWKSWRFRTLDNPHMDPAEIAQARADMPAAAFEQEYEGVPAEDSANPFGVAAIRACVGPLSTRPPVAFGVDLARAVDWTVVIGLDADGAVCYFDRWQHLPWNQTLVRITKAIGSVPTQADRTGIGDAIVEELQRRCPNVEGFLFTPQSKQGIMEGLAAQIHQSQVTYPDGPIPAELETFAYVYTPTRVKYSAPAGLHDDCVCALAMAVHGWRHQPHTAAIEVGSGRGVGSIWDDEDDARWQRVQF